MIPGKVGTVHYRTLIYIYGSKYIERSEAEYKYMINSTELIQKVTTYHESCKATHKRPSYYGISRVLGVCPQTIANVCSGTFNGNEYTATPAPTRCIDNNDFEIIKSIFI